MSAQRPTKKRQRSRFPSPTKLLYKIVISGDRNWYEEYVPIVRRVIFGLSEKYGTKNLLIIEGGAPGIDSMVKHIAEKSNIHVAEICALWDTRHRSAGGQRNEIMAALKPDEVICIHRDISASSGTANMFKLAKRLEIPTRLIDS